MPPTTVLFRCSRGWAGQFLPCLSAVVRLNGVLGPTAGLSFRRWKRPLLGAACLMCFFTGPLVATADSPALLGPEFWQVHPGLEQNTVTAIVQSRDGYLWLGTYHGLLRFDGARLTVFDSSNTPNLRNGSITALLEDPPGVLWVGHETGELTRLENGEFQSVTLGSNWAGGAVEALTIDEAGDLWLLNDAGMLFNARANKSLPVPGGASPARKVTLARGGQGRNWVVSNGSVFTLDHGTLVPFNFAGSPPGDFYERLLPARDGGLWVVGNQRLRKWVQGRWTSELPGLPGPPGAVTTLLETRSGAVLAGTLRDGLYLFSGREPLHFNRANGLSHDWVRALCEDHEGNLWLGTGAGMDGLRPRKVQMLDAPDGWRGCAVLSFAVEPDGSAWIGSEGAGLYHYRGGQWSSFTETSGVSNLFVWSVLETTAHQLLLGTWGGGVLARGENNQFTPVPELSSITAPATALYQAADGDLWLGTTAGLHRYHEGKPVWFAGKDQLALPDVRAIVQTSDGTVWFGMSGGGLGCVRDGQARQFRKPDGLGGDFIVSLYADADATLWIGTSDNGLTRLKNGKFSVISTTNGLPTRIISHIVDDGAGNLWLGSHRGILRASKAELDRCADGLTASVRFLSYGKAEGLSSEICSGGFQPGACRGADGRLWFPTAKGVAIVSPLNASTNAARPPVVIETLVVDNTPVNNGELAASAQSSGLAVPESVPGRVTSRRGASAAFAPPPLRIAPGRHRFEFHYTGLSFIDPEKVEFKYRLDGLEREWQEAGNKRLAQYSYLPPGGYTFRVMAANNDGLWNEAGASLSLVVLPFFWQTWWFEATCLAAGAGAIGFGVLWVTRRRVRRKLELLERQRALERERARIARDIHDDLGASLTRITMLSQSVRAEVENQPQTAADVDQIYGTARELTRAMDEIVWAVNPKHDTLDSLVTYLGRFAQHFLSAAGIRCRLDVPVNLPSYPLTSEIRHNLYLALKEALNNVVKHAGATEVRLSLELHPHGFFLLVADNGCGFDWQGLPARASKVSDNIRFASGNGVANMRRRLEEIGGRCEWDTAPGEGTRAKLVVVTSA